MERERPGIRAGAWLLLVVCFLVVGCQSGGPARLRAFESDGCSMFPDGTQKEPVLWRDDCVQHDFAYWKGGTCRERREADQRLRDGIRSKGKPMVAQIVYLGVRVGGHPWLPSPWRWGFGWTEFPRGYRSVSDDEIRVIEALLDQEK